MNPTTSLRSALLCVTLSLASGLGLACGETEQARTTGAPMAAPIGASSEAAPSADPTQPIARVLLRPPRPRPGELVTAEVEFAGAAARNPELEYEWFVNGRRADAQGNTMRVDGHAGRGAQIEVAVVAIQQGTRSDPVRAQTRIGNLPPVLRGVLIEPRNGVSAGHDVAATPQASDDDGDELSFDYRWEVNGSDVSQTGSVLPASFFKRGDEITVIVVASDGQDESQPIRSAPLRVKNADPRIVSTPGSFDDQGRFLYPVKVEDADGDRTFRFRLTEAPEGMEIDVVTGNVSWTPREDQAGRHPVKIEVSDMNGGKATQSFVVTLDFKDVNPAAAATSG